MDKWKKRAVDLFTSLAFGGEGSISVVPYYPQKLRISEGEERFFKRSTPESHGISSKRLYNMLTELELEERAKIHNLMLIKDGEVILECSSGGYGVNIRHLSHSMSKTVIGIAVMMLVDEGKLSLSDRLVDIFPEVEYRDKKFPLITVEHLLSMTSGVDFSEAGSVTELSWLETFFGAGVKFTPGESFAYNSMNSYVLARIVALVSEGGVVEYLKPRLFDPLMITNVYWELGPEGIEKGGWGLYLSAESWAKIGYTVLSGGEFFGRRILSKEAVAAMSSAHTVTPESTGDFDYGYHTWVSRRPGEILFNGMLGQNVWIYPKNNLVAVVSAGNNELFQLSPAMSIIREHLCGLISDDLSRADYKVLRRKAAEFFNSRREIIPQKPRGGLLCLLGIRKREVFDEGFADILGKYDFVENKVSLMPLFVVGMQNNFDMGLSHIELQRDGSDLRIDYTDGGVCGVIRAGFYGYRENVIDVRGEKYILRAMAGAIDTPYGEREYKIEFILPEMPNTRTLRIIRLDGDRIEISFSESPDQRVVDTLISRIPEKSAVLGFLLDMLERKFGKGFIGKKLEGLFHPRLVGVNSESAIRDTLLMAERESVGEDSASAKLIRSLVTRFFRESDTSDSDSHAKEAEGDQGGFSIQSIFSKLFGFGRRSAGDGGKEG